MTLVSSAFANKVRGTCCTEDVPVSERGFDEVVEGFEDGKATRDMMQVLWDLSARNMALVLVGDSMNAQVRVRVMERGGGCARLYYYCFQCFFSIVS